MTEQPVQLFISQKIPLTGQKLHNESEQCGMRGDRNFKVSDTSGPVYM